MLSQASTMSNECASGEVTLLTWLQHCPGGFHIAFLPLGSCPAEWGVGLGLQCLLNSLAGYTLRLSFNAQAPKSVIFTAKVCDWVLKSVIQSMLHSPPQYWMAKPVTLLHISTKVCSVWPKSVIPGGKVCFLFHLLSVHNPLILHQ